MVQRLTTWLCLLAAIVMGFAPAHGLILCLEPDGTIALEASVLDASCNGCPDSPSSGAPAESTLTAADEPCCACIDLPIYKLGDVDRKGRTGFELRLGSFDVTPIAHTVALPVLIDLPRQSFQSSPPRPAVSLRHHRTVVLHI